MKTWALDGDGVALVGSDMNAEINRGDAKSQRDLLLKIVASGEGKRKEAGHYSGLNENWRSKLF